VINGLKDESLIDDPTATIYGRALAALGHAAIITDVDGRVRYLNAAAEALYGYTRGEAAGQFVLDLVMPAHGHGPARVRSEAMLDGNPYAGDWEVQDKHGRAFTAHATSTVITDDGGLTIGMLSVSYDVTARRDAEDTARELAAIVEGSDDAIIRTDTDGEIRSANLSVTAMFGYAPQELIGANVAVLVPLEKREELATVMATIAAGGSYQVLTTTRTRKDGTTFDASIRLSPVRDAAGDVVGVSGITRDVTADVRTRSMLEASERRFRARFDDAQLPQAMVDLDGRISSVNNALCHLLLRDREQLEGGHFRDFRHTTDPGGEDRMAGVVSGHSDAESWDRILSLPDGSALPVLIQACLLRGADHAPSAIACFVHDISSLQHAQRALTRREKLFETLVRQASDFFLLVDVSGRLLYVSTSMTAAFGYDPAAITGHVGWDCVHPDDLPNALRVFDGVVGESGGSRTTVFRAIDGAGRWRWVEEVLTNCLDDPDIAGVVCNGRDVTVRVEAEQALRASEARYRAIADTAQEGIWTTDPIGRTLYANQKLADILGVALGVVYATPAAELLSPDDGAFIADKLRNRQERGPEEYELAYPHPDGRDRMLRLSVSPLRDETGTTGSLAMIADITEERRAAGELIRRALVDDLTGLANRSLLSDRLNQALARSQRPGGGPVAVLFADLDQFKLINDSWGHDAGDCLLVAVAERLSATVRTADTVARFGGDEFVVICEGASEREAEQIATKLLKALADPFDVAGHRAYISASIGIAVSPPSSGEELLRFADAAMYDAKSRGRGRAHVFDLTLAEEADGRLSLSNDLRDALADDGLMLHYQPLVELATGRVLGLEALARWTHDTRGPVSPTEFVAVAEATGLASTLDRWALSRACLDLSRMRALIDTSLHVSVNLSACHLADDDLEQTVVSALQKAGLPGDALQLEITESAMMDNPDRARAVLERLRTRGIGIAVDDFGTGYSSLEYLSRLPATTLKIDRTFIKDITVDPDSLAIVASIIDLARAMNLTTVAEGIETVEQLTLLHRLGCTAGQGFLWAPGLGLGELATQLHQLPDGLFDVSLGGSDNVRVHALEVVTADHGLRRMMRLHHDGASSTTIASALNSEGYRTPQGMRWHRKSVDQTVGDAAYPNLWTPRVS
jgi:diguanylate cyclase (GGDEF)-like protein/PAS domain S-box-containing protein